MFAQNTQIPIKKSQAEIQKILRNANATGYGIMERDDLGVVSFEMNGMAYKLALRIPKRADFRQEKKFMQLCRTKWRSMVLLLKAKFECVNSGISSIDVEFMPFMVVAEGATTVADVLKPRMEQSRKLGRPLSQFLSLPAPS